MVELWWGLFLSDNPTLFAAAATGVERGVTRLYSAHRRGLASRAPALFLAQSEKTRTGEH